MYDVIAGRHADGPPEVTAQMALIEEADFSRHYGWRCPTTQQSLRMPDAHETEVAMRRDAHFLPEQRREARNAQSGERGEHRKTHGLRERRFYKRDRPRDGARRRALQIGRRRRNRYRNNRRKHRGGNRQLSRRIIELLRHRRTRQAATGTELAVVSKRWIANGSIGVLVAPVSISSAITSPTPGPNWKP